jgi:hypothetical protein
MGRKKSQKAETRRIPFVLNLNDPVDAAIWEVLEPMLDIHRASAFIRAVLAEKILGTAEQWQIQPMNNFSTNGNGHKHPDSGQGSYALPTAKRPAQIPANIEQGDMSPSDEPSADDGSALDAATDNFLNAFG